MTEKDMDKEMARFTKLPDQTKFYFTSCTSIYRNPKIQEQIKKQYNLIVAATATILELAAYEYEKKWNMENHSSN